MLVQINNRGQQIADRVKLADTFWLRLKGLLGRKGLEPGEGLLLKPCSQIHTWFMAFPLDVLYLDGEGRILTAEAGMPPGRVGSWVKGCRQVLELPGGVISHFGLQSGQQLELVKKQ